MTTVRDIIKGAFRLLGTLASGESPAADEEQDALASLNDMLENWNLERLMVQTMDRTEHALVPGQGAYTIGVGGNFNTARPVRIESASVKVATGSQALELPIKILNLDEWLQILVTDTQLSEPTHLYLDQSFPLATINLWPVPSVTNTLVLWSWHQISAFSSVNDTVTLPPGYAKAIRYGLAIELAPEYGLAPNPVVVAIAADSKADIKRINSGPAYLGCDPALLMAGTFNILTGI